MCQISVPNQCAKSVHRAKSVWLFAGQNGDGMREQVDDGRQALERPLGRARQVDEQSTPAHCPPYPVRAVPPGSNAAWPLPARVPGGRRPRPSPRASGPVGPKPVPPVVTTSPVKADAIRVRSPATAATPSGAVDCSTTSNPASCSALATAGPLSSSRSPRMTESETVSTLAW